MAAYVIPAPAAALAARPWYSPTDAADQWGASTSPTARSVPASAATASSTRGATCL